MNTKRTTHATIILILLQEHRLSQRVTQKFIAEQLGLHPAAYNKIENGISQLPLDKLYGVCTALKMYPSTLLNHAEQIAIFLSLNGWSIGEYSDDNPKDDLAIARITNKDYGLVSFVDITPKYGYTLFPALIKELLKNNSIITDNSEYKFGHNVDMVLTAVPETSEDGIRK